MSNMTQKFLAATTSTEGVVFVLGNGKTLTVKVEDFGPDMQRMFAVHGMKQKIGDAAAGFARDKDYTGAFAEMSDVYQNCKDGNWNRGRTGTAGSKMQLLAEAIARIKKVDVEKALVAVQGATPEVRDGWAKNALIAKVMAEITAEKLAAVAAESEDAIEGLDL